MGSSIQLRINNEKRSVLNHEQKITLDLEVPFTMQVTFYWLKSPVYTVKEAKPVYVITNLPVLISGNWIGGRFPTKSIFQFFCSYRVICGLFLYKKPGIFDQGGKLWQTLIFF